MARKDKPFVVLDTHAGIGHYDLTADEALRTNEAGSGILKLRQSPPPELTDYLALIEKLSLYPGSPAIAAALLRPQDRLVASELHPEEYRKLRRFFARNPQVATHLRDGYESLRAFLPPPERRALILIDPPYEAEGEFQTLAQNLIMAQRRFQSGVILAWYPIKHRAPVRQFHQSMIDSGIKDLIATEFYLREPLDAARLNGCGLLWLNPPYLAEQQLPPILTALHTGLSQNEPGSGTALIRLTDA